LATQNAISAAGENDLELLGTLQKARGTLADQIARRIVGQHEIVDSLVCAILSGGHVILIGVPGLAKTLLIQTLAQALDLPFSRIQFTPDLMPSDITGTELLEEEHGTGKRVFKFQPGPIFASIVLADEINRAPPKTQAALLEAMQEHRVTASGKTYQLPEPFFVLATQNPIEHDGTYSLPEAQLDRFMFELKVGYPSKEEEIKIVSSTTGAHTNEIKPVLTGAQILEMQRLVRRLPAPPSLIEYAVDLARSTRPGQPGASADVKKFVSFGAGPRASQYMVLGAKARAAMDGRSVPDIDDVKAVAHNVLGHRLVMNFQAEAEGVGVERLLAL
jgi:MoxR-like ATPase